MNNYEAVYQVLKSGIYSKNDEILMEFVFDTPMGGSAIFTDLIRNEVFNGRFLLTTKAKSGAYMIRLTFPNDVYLSRMPKLNHTVAEVRHLQDALTYALMPHTV